MTTTLKRGSEIPHQVRDDKVKGFTLIEVLVALIILAIALLAVVKVIARSTESEVILENKNIAMWVAEDVIAQAELGLIDLNNGAAREGKMQMMGREWDWQASIQKTTVNEVKVEVQVPGARHDSVELFGALED